MPRGPALERAARLVRRARARLFGSGLARDVNGGWRPAAGRPARRALLLHVVELFRSKPGRHAHQNVGQVHELSRALAERGFALDVADWFERRPILRGAYDLVIDLHPREPALYDAHLAPNAIRLSYIGGCNPSWSNAAERERLEALRARRGVSLEPRRQVPPFPARRFESFDAMLTFAGPTAIRTFDEFRLPPVHRLVNNGYEDLVPTSPDRRDPRCFLFLASLGQVHKGLDLLLEVFAARPALTLIVLSRFRQEPDFVDAYRRELFESANI
ncbi:MAG TPA: hypothetical protein VE326_02350, partial [Candidatus Binatia bacterium]|nr:hypothetical protein [Candidatus Binatia bacterium]